MPNFTFTSPDGRKITVTGPDGATVDQAFQIAQQQLGAPKQPGYQSSQGGGFVPLAQGVAEAKTTSPFETAAVPVGAALTDTGRALNQLGSYVGAAGGPGAMAGMSGIGQAEANQALTDQEQPARDEAAKQNPRTYYGLYAPTSVLSMAPFGEVAGTAGRAATAAATGLDAGPINPGVLARALGWTAPKAAQGAAYGAQTPGDTGTNAAAGAVLGPLADLGVTGLVKGVKAVPGVTDAVSGFGKKLFTPDAAAKNTVRGILADSQTGAPTLAQTLPGTSMTAGGQTLDPGLQSLEQAVRSRTVNGLPNEALYQAQQRSNSAAVHQAINGIADATQPTDKTSAAAYDALQAAHDARRETEQGLWKQIPADTKVDAAKTSSAVDGFINKQSVTNQRVIQRAAGDFLDDFKATVAKYAQESDGETQVKMPFGEVKDLRSTLGQSIRDAQKAGNSNAVRLLKGIDDKLLSTLGDENALLGVPEPSGSAVLDSANAKLAKMNGTVTGQDLGDAYNAARRFTADTHNNFFTPDVKALLDKDPAKVLDAATQTPDKLRGYLNAASQAPDGGAAAKDAVRKYLLNDALTRSSGSARGGSQAFVDGQKLAKYLADNRSVMEQVFSPQELQQLDTSATTAYRNIATEAASPRLGSNTIQKYLGNKGLSGQLSQGDMGTGTVGKIATSIRNGLLGRYQVGTEKYLRDALLDPNYPSLGKLFIAPKPVPQWLLPQVPGPVKTSAQALFDPRAMLIRAALLQQKPQQ